MVHGDGQSRPRSVCDPIDDVKKLRDSSKLPGFERVGGSAHHPAARKRPASARQV